MIVQGVPARTLGDCLPQGCSLQMPVLRSNEERGRPLHARRVPELGLGLAWGIRCRLGFLRCESGLIAGEHVEGRTVIRHPMLNF